MNSYQQVLERAEAIKAQKWAQLHGLPLRALRDSATHSRLTVKIHGRSLVLVRATEMNASDLARRGWYRGMLVIEYRRFNQDWRRCGACGLFKRRNAFSPDPRNADGLHSYCKPCRAKDERAAYHSGKRRRRKKSKTR